MGRISGRQDPTPIPDACDGIDTNFCPNPSCRNFCVPLMLASRDPNYTYTGSGKTRCAKCRQCKRHFLIKSNKAIVDEVDRLRYRAEIAKVYRQDGYCCHNKDCHNFGRSAARYPSLYRKNGRTSQGNQRLQCKMCSASVTPESTKRTAHPESKRHLNEQTYRLLCNKVPLSRIPEILGISIATVYRKIDMFYERSIALMMERESRLNTRSLGRMYLSTDRQEYHSNWTDEKDKRHVVVSAIASADRRSGYVFGFESNFDPSINLARLHSTSIVDEDQNLPPYMRQTARLWTNADYQNAVEANKALETTYGEHILHNASLESEIYARQAEENEAWEIEHGSPPGAFTGESYLPANGSLVHLEYTMYAHFLKLAETLGHADNLNFFVDREAGINRAIALAFGDRFLDKNFAALYVAFSKNLTVNQKQRLVRQTQTDIKRIIESGLAHTRLEAEKIISEAAVENAARTYKGREYFSIPIHRMNEAERFVSFITPYEAMSVRNRAFLARIATLAPVDTVFNQVRRRLQGLERPIHSQSNNSRVWTGYSPYSPDQINKMLQIFRCYRNYVLLGKDGRTPAERLGIARGPVEIRKILYP